MKLALFDLDDTLFDGDTEAEWTKFMDTNGFIKDPSFFIKMEEFTNNYRGGKLDVDEERLVRRVADLIRIKDIEVLKLKDLSKN